MDIFKIFGSVFIKTDEANKVIDDTAKKGKNLAQTLGGALQTAGDKITGVGKALAPVSAVMAGALTASVKGASDFTDSMAKMSTLFDTSQTSVEDLSKQFLDLSSRTGQSATELAEAGYQAISAGQSVENAVGFVETASNLARAGFTSTVTAVDVLTTAMNAYGESAGTAEEIGNKLVRTQNLGKTTVDELASSMGKIIPTASSMNVNIDNLTSGYVSLTKQGIATAEATTYMNSMMNELGDSGTDVGKILKQKTGKSFQQLMADGNSLGDVLSVLQTHAEKSGTNFNELWSSAEAGKSALAILNGGVDEFNATVDTMSQKSDDIGSALEKLETPSVKLQRAFNQIKNAGVELGQSIMSALAPTIGKVADGVSKLTTWFGSLDEKTKVTIATVMGVVAVASPVLVAVGKLTTGVGKFVSGIGGAINKVGGLSGVLSAITSPVGIAVMAIGALIAIIVTMYNTNEDFRNLCQEVWASVKELISTAVEAIKGVIESFVASAKAFWAEWGDSITEVASNAWNLIQTIITAGMNVIHAVIKTITAVIKGDWSGAWEGVKSIFTNIWNGLKNIVSSAMPFIKTAIETGLNLALTVVNNILNKIKDKFNSIMDGAKEIVSKAINAIKDKFNFSWSLPPLKLPHITISGSFSLSPPSVPKFGISWYKKAMDEPYMFTKPTLFGMNPMTGMLKGAGEAGDEVMIGKDTMLEMIRQAVASESSVYLQRIVELLQMFFPEVLTTMDRPIMWDNQVIAKKLAPAMSVAIGKIETNKGRGR